MHCIASRKVWLYAIATSLIVAGVSVKNATWAQDTKKAAKKSDAKSAASEQRLPAHYAKVVDDEQRDKIYAIQKTHAAKIAALRAELKAALEKRDAEIEAVLSAKQKAEVKALAAEAKQRRAADAARDKAAGDETDAKPAAKATIRSPGKTATKKAG